MSAPAIPSMHDLATRPAAQHAERLRYWARHSAISTKMQRELLAAADFIERGNAWTTSEASAQPATRTSAGFPGR